MTDDRSIERAARSWLEVGPTEAPERAVEAALLLIDTTPQERDWHVPWRFPDMTLLVRSLVGVAAVVVLLVGAAMLLKPAADTGVGLQPSISPSASPAASPRFSLTDRFTSPLMGYSIGTAADWTTEPATEVWTGTTTNDPPAADVIHVTGTDSAITIASQPMPADTTFDAWLARFHQDSIAGVPQGCDGGEPSTWPTVDIGPAQGVVQHLCNAEIAFVEVGGRIFTFWLGSETFTANQHLHESEFNDVLRTVVFDPASASDQP